MLSTPTSCKIWLTGVLLLALFAETRLDKVPARKLEKHLRSSRNCRHAYSLGATATRRSSDRICIFVQNKSGSWPRCSTVSDLSCYHAKSAKSLFSEHRVRGSGAREPESYHFVNFSTFLVSFPTTGNKTLKARRPPWYQCLRSRKWREHLATSDDLLYREI